MYMATRNKRKAEEAIAELNERTGRLAIYLELDLSSLSSVKRAAEEFMRFARHDYGITGMSS